jgi:N-acetyl-anhydromuramyl-L-alanine amidase AmpD
MNNKLYSVNGTLTWFTDVNVHKNKTTGIIENKVSAHYVIPRGIHNGNDLYNLVKDPDIAYHAGISQWTIGDKLRKYINRYSIGIEMEGDGNLVEYTDFQYDVLTWLVKDLMGQYNIPESNIIGHEDIAPGRKIDPGKLFDWKKFRTMLTPPIIVEAAEVSNIEPPALQPQADKPLNTNPTIEEPFFMGDGSKTYGVFMQIIRAVIGIFRVKFKSS